MENKTSEFKKYNSIYRELLNNIIISEYDNTLEIKFFFTLTLYQRNWILPTSFDFIDFHLLIKFDNQNEFEGLFIERNGIIITYDKFIDDMKDLDIETNKINCFYIDDNINFTIDPKIFEMILDISKHKNKINNIEMKNITIKN